MKHLVYGVIGPGDRGGGGDGLPDGLTVLESGELVLIYSTVDDRELIPTVPRLQAFARTLSEIHQRHTLIPFRFGCAFDSTSDLDRLLDEKRRLWIDLLLSLDHCDEYCVHFLSPTAASSEETGPPPPGEAAGADAEGPGTRYLMALRPAARALRARRSQAEAMAERLRGGLQGLYRRCQAGSSSSEDELPLYLLVLVHRPSSPAFRAELERLARAEGWRILLTGPWPPSHFVLDPGGPGGPPGL